MSRRLAFAACVLLTLLGVAALVGMALEGADPRWRWGYVAATLSFLLSVQMAPAVAFTSRLGRGYWGVPLRRIADVLAIAGVVSAPVFFVLGAQLPPWLGRPSIWSDWPFAPQLWDGIAIVGLALTGAALVWSSSTRPDRRRVLAQRQWRVVTAGVVMLGGFYTMLAVFVQLLVSSDLALSLVPGWHSAVLSAYQVVSAYQAALALVVVLSSRNRAAAEREQTYHACAKILLALGMLWFYFVWCELLTNWYGRTPDEQSLLSLFMFGPGGPLFFVATVCEFIVPIFVLMWNGARKNANWTIGVASVVLIGNFVDRLRVYLGAWSVATQAPEAHLPESLPPLPLPGLFELAVCVGLLAAAALVVAIVLTRVPAVAAWELRAAERLTPERRLLRTRVSVVGRPS